MGFEHSGDQSERGGDEGSTGDTANSPQDEEGVLVRQEGDDEVEDTEGDEAKCEDGLGRAV